MLMKINIRNLKLEYKYEERVDILRRLVIIVSLKTDQTYYTYYADIQTLSLEDVSILKQSVYETWIK